jgi:hypothetical protein
MFAKISLTAAFLLMVAPPIACASNRDAASFASMTRPANQQPRRVVLAQDGQPNFSQPNLGTSDNDNDNDNDSTDSDDDKQDNGDNDADQQNAAGEGPSIPPTVLGAPDNDSGDAPQVPQTNAYPLSIRPDQ